MYFRSDIKKLCGSTLIRFTLGTMLLIAAADPISVYWQASRYPGFFEQIGKHPYQFWLLINSAGWGNQVYNTLFWIFPVLLTGLVYCEEQNTSVRKLLVVRGGNRAYLLAKTASVFVFSFVSVSVIFLLNLAVTYSVFPASTGYTSQYQHVVPVSGSFAASIYHVAPPLLAVTYALLNALTIAVFSVISLSFHMVFTFRNKFIAVAVPAIAFYAVTFLFDAVPGLSAHNIRIMIQPSAATGPMGKITFADLWLTFSCWLSAAVGLSVLGFRTNKEIL